MIERLVGMLDDVGRAATELRGTPASEIPGLLDDLVHRLDDVSRESTGLIGELEDVSPILHVRDEALAHGSAAHRLGTDLKHGADAGRGVAELAEVIPGWASVARQRVQDAASMPSLTADYLAGLAGSGDDLVRRISVAPHWLG